MSTKRKLITIIIGIETVIIATLIIFLFYINSDTVRINRQLELAQRYLLEEDYEQAIAAFEIVIEIDPKNVDAYLGLAEAYVSADELGNAVRTLEKAAKQTDSEEVLVMLEMHTAEIEQRQLAAQRAAEAASAVDAANAVETTTNVQYTTTETLTPETEIVLRGFIVQDGDLYYYDETGNLVTGWFDNNNNQYCARIDGRLYKDGEHEIDGTRYLFDQGGVCLGEIAAEKKLLKKKELYLADGTLKDCRIYNYDNQGNLIKEERKTYNEYILYSYDNQGNLIRGEYVDSSGNQLWNTDVYYYDSQGNMVRKEYFDSRFETPILLYTTIWNYDSQGNMIESKTFEGDENDGVALSDICSYDNQGNIISKEHHGQDGSRTYTNYDYDNQGNVIRVEEDHYLGSYESHSYTNYNYNNQGNIIKEETYNLDGTLEYCAIYDNEGSIIREEWYEDNALFSYTVYSY